MTSLVRAAPVVALLVVLAGCGSVLGPSTPELPDGADFPADTDRDGLGDLGSLLEAHRQQLADTDYRYRLSITSDNASTPPIPTNVSVHAGTVDGERAVRVTEFREGSNGGAWTRPTTEFERRSTASGGHRYVYRHNPDGVVFGRPGPSPLTGSVSALEYFLDRGEFAYAGTTTVDGTALLRFEASDPADDADLGDYEGTVLVSPAGLVHRANVTTTRPVWPREETTFRYDLDPDAGPPERPDWTDEVPQLRLSVGEDEHVAVLRNAGGAALPANASFLANTFVDGELARNRSLSVPERLAPGDRAYVYVVDVGDGYAIRASTTRPAPSADLVPLNDSALDDTLVLVHDGDRFRLSVDAGIETTDD